MKYKILILDYNVGNVNSVIKAVRHLGHDPIFSKNKEDIEKADKIILPGQGSFDFAMKQINHLKLEKEILEHVKKKKLLGICLGMQILASVGYENGKKTKGLNLIPGKVIKFQSKKKIKLPHIGWNEVKQVKKNKIFDNILDKADFYHCHSYIFKSLNIKNVIGTSRYHDKFANVINKDNVFGVQFHPEKSLKSGLKLIENFLNLE